MIETGTKGIPNFYQKFVLYYECLFTQLRNDKQNKSFEELLWRAVFSNMLQTNNSNKSTKGIMSTNKICSCRIIILEETLYE